MYNHMLKYDVEADMYANDWLFSLFLSILPDSSTDITSIFISNFFRYKWEFFYKLILSILKYLEPRIMKAKSMFDILELFKNTVSSPHFKYNSGQLPWL